MALLKGHYEEVDALLAGELPVTIASGFAASGGALRTLRAGDRRTSSILDIAADEQQPLLASQSSREETRDRYNRVVINSLWHVRREVLMRQSIPASTFSSLLPKALRSFHPVLLACWRLLWILL